MLYIGCFNGFLCCHTAIDQCIHSLTYNYSFVKYELHTKFTPILKNDIRKYKIYTQNIKNTPRTVSAGFLWYHIETVKSSLQYKAYFITDDFIIGTYSYITVKPFIT